MREWIAYRAAQLVLQSLAHAPLPMANRLARAYAATLDRLIPRLRRVGIRNLEMAFPQLSRAHRTLLIDGVFRSIGRLLVALARFPQINSENVSQWIRYEGYEHFEAALARGKGVLFATAHLGNWELSAFAHALLSAPMHVVVRPLDNPLIDALVKRRRGLSGNHLIGKRDFSRSILKALHRNEAVGILVDQNSSLDNAVFVDFFGIPACTSLSFARIAAHSGAAVIPGFAVWSEAESRYILRFYPAVAITGDAAEDTRRIQKIIEAAIAEYPDQWLWIHRRWKTRPPGEPPLYD
ncbi:MAG: lysophospholipid acyltransferase family protein [Acidobacteriota bacterium]|nr:lysophospholipid acyltransferase family protein [Acidobacteriota bacterium]